MISPGPFESAMKMPPSLVVAVSDPIAVSIASPVVPMALLRPVVVKFTPLAAVRLTAGPFASVIAPFRAVRVTNPAPADTAPMATPPAVSVMNTPPLTVAASRFVALTSRVGFASVNFPMPVTAVREMLVATMSGSLALLSVMAPPLALIVTVPPLATGPLSVTLSAVTDRFPLRVRPAIVAESAPPSRSMSMEVTTLASQRTTVVPVPEQLAACVPLTVMFSVSVKR